LSSCSILQKSTKTFSSLSASDIVSRSQQNMVEFNWFSAKVSGTAFVQEKAMPINGSIRIKKDSIIWISVSAIFGIEAARMVLTPDSLKMINRLNSTYVVSDISSLSSRFGISYSYKQIEEMLVGNWSLEDLDWKVELDNDQYMLNYLNQDFSALAKIDTLFNLVEYSQTSSSVSQSMWLNYPNFVEVDYKKLPQAIKLNFVQDKKKLKIDFKYSKILIDKEKSLNFSIPNGYESAL
jgi:hypothetical protein